MRKIAIVAGAILVLGAAGGFAGLKWAESKAATEVERTFAALRAAGATVDHAAPRIDIWSRTVLVDDIAIGHPATAGKALKIGRLQAEGVGLFTTDFDARRVGISNITFEHAFSGKADQAIKVSVPNLILSDVFLPKAAPAGSSQSDPVSTAGAYVQRIRMASIDAPRLEMTASLPTPPPTANRYQAQRKPQGPLKYVYDGVKFERIDDGRIGKIILSKGTMTTGSDNVTMEESVSEGIDMMPFFAVGLQNRTPRDGYYTIQEKQTLGRMSMIMPDGGTVTIGSMTSGPAAIDPSKTSIKLVFEMLALINQFGPQPQPAQMAAVMEMLGRIYEGIRMDDFRMLDTKVSVPAAQGGTFNMASFAMLGLDRGKFKRLQVDGIEVGFPAVRPGTRTPVQQQVKLGLFALNGLDIAAMFRAVPALTAPIRPGQAPPSLGLIAGLVEGFQLTGLAIPDFGNGEMSIDDMSASWGEIANDMPGAVRYAFKGTVPINPRDPNFTPFAAKGIRRLAIDIETASRYRPDTFELTLSPIKADVEHLGALSGTLTFSSITPSTYAMLPLDFPRLSQQMMVKGLELKLADRGLVENFYLPSLQPGPSGMMPPDFITMLRATLLDPATPGGNIGAIIDALDRFLREPRQTFSAKLDATSAVRVGELLGSAPGASPETVARTLEKFSVDVRVSKN